MGEHLTDRQQAFCDELADLLRRYADVCGPVHVEDKEELVTAEDLAGMQPVENAALNEWVVLSSWVDLDSSETYTSAFAQPGMPTYHRVGLLRIWDRIWTD